MGLKKIDKKFILSDSSVNEYGFRLLTAGYQLADYQKNPIGYYMHQRENGVVLKWVDISVEDDNLVAYPEINLSNPRGQQTCDEIENGFLNAASVGHIVVLEYSTDPEMMLPGQTGPTVTKWYNKECSIVDIPGNSNALTQLYDSDDNIINLSDFTNKNSINDIMKKFTLNIDADLMKKVGLAANGDDAALLQCIQDLVAKIDTLTLQNTELQSKIDNAGSAAKEKEVTDMLDVALTSKKITVELKNAFALQYKGKPDELKVVLAALPTHASVTDAIEKVERGTDAEFKKFNNLSFDEIDKKGLLRDLKTKFPDLYLEKYKEAFGYEPNTKPVPAR